MHALFVALSVTATVGILFASTPTAAQVSQPQGPPGAEIPPPAQKVRRVEITKGPELEGAREDLAILRWTTTNPGGADEHFAVVHYGTGPKDLNHVARSPIRINRANPETIFRVRMSGLKPRTTYYYKVTSTERNGRSDGVESPVHQFTTPGPGERVVNYPVQPARPQ